MILTLTPSDYLFLYICKTKIKKMVTVRMTDMEYQAYQLYLKSIKVMLKAGNIGSISLL